MTSIHRWSSTTPSASSTFDIAATTLTLVPDGQYSFGRQCTSVEENQRQAPSTDGVLVTVSADSAAFLFFTGCEKTTITGMPTPKRPSKRPARKPSKVAASTKKKKASASKPKKRAPKPNTRAPKRTTARPTGVDTIESHPGYRRLLERLTPGPAANGLLFFTKPGALDDEMSDWLLGNVQGRRSLGRTAFGELIIFRDVHPLRELPGVFANAASLVGAVVVLLGVALGLTNWLVLQEVPTHLVEWVQRSIQSRFVFLLALNVILLVLGSVLEIYSAIVVLVPLVAPLGVAYNIHPVHLGVIFLANLELGFLFPPMGLNLFLSATRFQKPLPTLYRHALPFLLIMAIGVLFITYVEPATTLLLRLAH